MKPKPIHDPGEGPLKTLALMSGSGTNVRRVLELGERLKREEGHSPFEVAVIFSDRYDSNANQIGREYDIPVVTHDLVGWLKRNGVDRQDLSARERFDDRTIEMLEPFGAKVAIYGGYMSIVSPRFIDAFLGVNVHPADLSVKREDGKRRWTGAHAVRDAIEAGEKTIRSSTHLVIHEVDMGPLLIVSAPVEVKTPEGFDPSDRAELQRVADENQERLKEEGDWVVFPLAIEAIARGWFARGDGGEMFYKGEPVPGGLRL